MAREFRHSSPAIKETRKKHCGRLKAKKCYTLNDTYNFTNNKVNPNETAEERHERKMERIIYEWFNRKEKGHNGLKGFHLHDADIAHYDRRAEEYYRMKDKLEQLDRVSDYAERNMIGHKLTAIRADFENLELYSKRHNVHSYECEKVE